MRRVVLACLAACGSSPSGPHEPPAGCNPLIGDDCLTPFPSSFYEAADASTATGVRVANALPGDRQALLIRPQTRLAPATRYVIALVGLNDASGKPLAPAPFVALRDKGELSAALTALQPRYEDLFSHLDLAGVPR